jgi:hypothetical protein
MRKTVLVSVAVLGVCGAALAQTDPTCSMQKSTIAQGNAPGSKCDGSGQGLGPTEAMPVRAPAQRLAKVRRRSRVIRPRAEAWVAIQAAVRQAAQQNKFPGMAVCEAAVARYRIRVILGRR